MAPTELPQAKRHLLEAYALLNDFRADWKHDRAVAAQGLLAADHIFEARAAVVGAEDLLRARQPPPDP